MARFTTSFKLSDPNVTFGDGTSLRVTKFAGVATLWTPAGSDRRAFSLPGDEDLHPRFQAALDELQIRQAQTIHVDVTLSAAARQQMAERSGSDRIVLRPAVLPDSEQTVPVVLYQDESGGLSWHFPDHFFSRTGPLTISADSRPTFTIDTRTVEAAEAVRTGATVSPLRALVTKLGRKVFKVLAVPAGRLVEQAGAAIVSEIEARFRRELVRGLSPDNYLLPATEPFEDWRGLANKRSLLVVHGTFSSSDGALTLLPRETMDRLHQHYQGRVIGFDHPTISQSPEENARAFLRELKKRGRPGEEFEFDVLSHSRGGIVTRALVEHGATLVPGHPGRFRKAYFVATPNQGTLLANPRHLLHLIDTYTNMLVSFPDGWAAYSIEVIVSVVKLLANRPQEVLPGLTSLGAGSRDYIARQLNRGTLACSTEYAAAAADYEPDPRRDNAFFTGRFAKKVTSQVFTQDGDRLANDLVVPRDSVFSENAFSSFPIRKEVVFKPADGVWHSGFLSERRTLEDIEDHFEVPVAWADYGKWPELDLHAHVPSRPATGAGARGSDDEIEDEEVEEEEEAEFDEAIDVLRSPADASDVAPAESAPVPPAPAVELERRPYINFHEQVREGVSNPLVVGLSAMGPEARAAAEKWIKIALAEGKSHVDITVLLSAPGFESAEGPVQIMRVGRKSDADSEKVTYNLTALSVGAEPVLREISADFWLGTACIGSVTHRTVVIGKDAQGGMRDGSSNFDPFTIMSESRKECDLVIHVLGVNEPDEAPYKMLITTRNLPVTFDNKPVGLWNLSSKELEEHLWKSINPHIEAFRALRSVPAAERKEALEALNQAFLTSLDGLGGWLWDKLPEAFRREYLDLMQGKERPKSVLINSTEMAFPWELVIPYGNVGGQQVKGEALGRAHVLGRWKPGASHKPVPQHLLVKKFCIVNPQYSGANQLPWSSDEVVELQELFPKIDPIAPANVKTLNDRVLKCDDIQMFHFTGHGNSHPTDPDLTYLLLEKDQRLTAQDFRGSMLVTHSCPIVYLNACSTGVVGTSFAQPAGFAATFVGRGATGIIAPYWPITDRSALHFSASLYRKLLSGRAVGEALQELRAENPDDWTIRAFSYFGDPWARLRFAM